MIYITTPDDPPSLHELSISYYEGETCLLDVEEIELIEQDGEVLAVVYCSDGLVYVMRKEK